MTKIAAILAYYRVAYATHVAHLTGSDADIAAADRAEEEAYRTACETITHDETVAINEAAYADAHAALRPAR